jgi:hypothetical protein
MRNMAQDVISPHTSLITVIEAHLRQCSQAQFMEVLDAVISTRARVEFASNEDHQ